jgi:hypothetical protein
MGIAYRGGLGARRSEAREVCDKCGGLMSLQGSGQGFERWACTHCRQVIGIDRDLEVGGRFQLQRGHPWRYNKDAFTA